MKKSNRKSLSVLCFENPPRVSNAHLLKRCTSQMVTDTIFAVRDQVMAIASSVTVVGHRHHHHPIYPSDVSPSTRIASNTERVTVISCHHHQRLADIHCVQHCLSVKVRGKTYFGFSLLELPFQGPTFQRELFQQRSHDLPKIGQTSHLLKIEN